MDLELSDTSSVGKSEYIESRSKVTIEATSFVIFGGVLTTTTLGVFFFF